MVISFKPVKYVVEPEPYNISAGFYCYYFGIDDFLEVLYV